MSERTPQSEPLPTALDAEDPDPEGESPLNAKIHVLNEDEPKISDLASANIPERLPRPISALSLNLDICRICHSEASVDNPLITPCRCSGTLRYVHQNCMQKWIKSSQTKKCEVCRYAFHMQATLKPFTKWEKPKAFLNRYERRKIYCSMAFHVVAIICVVWSLYVLVENTIDEIRSKNTLKWSFWTKLIVVLIGFIGAVVFMYVQCKIYYKLFERWKGYNKVVFVENRPESEQQPCTSDNAKQNHDANV